MRLAAGIVLLAISAFAAGLFPAWAAAHLDANLVGVPPSDPAEWGYHGISAEESGRWIAEGIIFAAWAAQWRDEGFSAESAGQWHQIANVHTAGDFLKNGFGPEEASEWMREGIRSGQRAREYLTVGLDAREAGAFWKKGLYPDEAKEWRNAGFDAEAMLQWRYGPRSSKFYFTREAPFSRAVYDLAFAKAWRDAGFLPQEAHRAIACRFELAEAKSWKEAGFSFDDFVAWKDSGFALEEAVASRGAGLGAVEAERRRYASSDKEDELSGLHVDITVRKDGRLDVVETATLVDRPKGAYREGYERHPVPGEVKSVEADGRPLDSVVEGGVLRIRKGGAPLPEGEHRITLAYTTDTLIEEEPHHDELSFPVVAGVGQGNHIGKASATVRLPQGAHVIFADGLAGLRERKDFVAEVEETGQGDVVRYSVTRPLREGMAFSLKLGFVQGYVRPSWLQRFGVLDRQCLRLLSSLLLFVAGLGLCCLYYGAAWLKVGRDPKGRGGAVTGFSPPADIGPAGMRALMARGKTDHLSVAAQLLSLAVRGSIRIFEAEGAYKFEKMPAAVPGLTNLEKGFLFNLFAGQDKVIIAGRFKTKPLKEAGQALGTAWKNEYRTETEQNTRHLWPGILLSVPFLGASLAVIDRDRLLNMEHGGVFLALYAALLAAGFGLLALLFARLLRRPSREHVCRMERLRAYADFLRRSFTDLDKRGYLPPFLQPHLPYAMASGADVGRLMIRSGEARWYKGASGGFACGEFIITVKRSL
jgi:hypothetical protein